MLNTQRDRIYSERRKALLADNLTAVMVEYSEETMSDILEVRHPTSHMSHQLPRELTWKLEGFQ